MVKAIIFDCFGVLATEAWLPFKAKYFAHDPELLKQANELSWQGNGGLINYDDFMCSIAELAGLTPAECSHYIDRNRPDEQLFEYIGELKKDYKLSILSNATADRLKVIFTNDQLALFDAIGLSFESGHLKPEREAFVAAAEQLSVDVGECVFIDDQQSNIKGAEAAGMPALLYSGATSLRRDLPKLLKT